MTTSIEASYNKFISKLHSLRDLARADTIMRVLDNLRTDFDLAVCPILATYYNGGNESEATDEFRRIVCIENFAARYNDILNDAKILFPVNSKRFDAMKLVDILTRRNYDYEICACGERLITCTESSEMKCTGCGQLIKVIGTIFTDEVPTVESKKIKHGSYDTSRHYRYWMERLRGMEARSFSQRELKKINTAIERDKLVKRKLSCEQMRAILKDPTVNMATANDHAVLLLILCGGEPPPQLTHDEIRLASIKFNKIMKYYESVNPDGGNKPYYPYFIYKIFEGMFAGNQEKLRFLRYIHMQSRETTMKNDKIFAEICRIATPEDGLEYRPTNVAE